MKYWTYLEIRTKVRKDLGIEQEDFITADELKGYCNMAIDDAESEIHSIYEDYFLTDTPMATVADQASYEMPDDIYANKIRALIYTLGSEVYPIIRFANMANLFEAIEADKLSTSSVYRYHLTNRSAVSGVKIQLTPVPKISASNMILYYIRNANRMEDDTSLCDIPEFVDYVIQFMKVRCYEKEGHPTLSTAIGMLEYKKKNMINTLSNMVPDDDNILDQDTSFYWDMGGNLEVNQY